MLSERICQLRRKCGLSQEQLAERIGVSRQAISKWESGTSTPELEKLIALSECFQITLDELIREPVSAGDAEEAAEHTGTEKAFKTAKTKVGIGFCLAGAVCLILSGLMMTMSPEAAEQLNASSTINFERRRCMAHPLCPFYDCRLGTHTAKKMKIEVKRYEKAELFICCRCHCAV